MTNSPPYDAILVVSFGGPETPEDVMPFLRNVVKGRNVPDERLAKVAEHYHHFGGKSPINDHCRALIQALQKELATHGIELPIYWGNRNWTPLLTDTVTQMKRDGIQRALAYVTSAYGSYSGCRQYLEDIQTAQATAQTAVSQHTEHPANSLQAQAPIIDKLRLFYNHPGFISPMVERVQQALGQLPEALREHARIAFTAHSIPTAMADHCDYVQQLQETCRLIAGALGHRPWQLVFQSRSGPPSVPWLEPDILDHIDAIQAIGAEAIVVVPVGFLSDHIEVLWDLDEEAQQRAEEHHLAFARAKTVGHHPTFIAMIRELIQERLSADNANTSDTNTKPSTPPRALGEYGPSPNQCAPNCCKYEPKRRPATQLP